MTSLLKIYLPTSQSGYSGIIVEHQDILQETCVGVIDREILHFKQLLNNGICLMRSSYKLINSVKWSLIIDTSSESSRSVLA